VEKFPGHIACSSLSRSEIVIPLFQGSQVYGVLDVDSREPDQFDTTDQHYLEKIVALLPL
jgi:GAF domain-containing protein